MSKFMKIFIVSVLFIICLACSIALYALNLTGYLIICLALDIVLFISLIIVIYNNRSNERVYLSKLNRIIKTYNSVLVKSSTLPRIENKNVILVESINDLINAQIEIRKPIYYKQQDNCCSFMLLDNNEVCCFVLRVDDEVLSDLDYMIEEIKNKKEKIDIDHSILDDIDKTTIIKLDNLRTYKVSPVRKEKKEVVESSEDKEDDLAKLSEKKDVIYIEDEVLN